MYAFSLYNVEWWKKGLIVVRTCTIIYTTHWDQEMRATISSQKEKVWSEENVQPYLILKSIQGHITTKQRHSWTVTGLCFLLPH